VNTFGRMFGTIDLGSCIKSVLGFGIKTGYDILCSMLIRDLYHLRSVASFVMTAYSGQILSKRVKRN
jgi:hypothetical protein